MFDLLDLSLELDLGILFLVSQTFAFELCLDVVIVAVGLRESYSLSKIKVKYSKYSLR